MRFRHDASCEACEDIKKALVLLRKIEQANFSHETPEQMMWAMQQEAKSAAAILLPLVAVPESLGAREPRDRT